MEAEFKRLANNYVKVYVEVPLYSKEKYKIIPPDKCARRAKILTKFIDLFHVMKIFGDLNRGNNKWTICARFEPHLEEIQPPISTGRTTFPFDTLTQQRSRFTLNDYLTYLKSDVSKAEFADYCNKLNSGVSVHNNRHAKPKADIYYVARTSDSSLICSDDMKILNQYNRLIEVLIKSDPLAPPIIPEFKRTYIDNKIRKFMIVKIEKIMPGVSLAPMTMAKYPLIRFKKPMNNLAWLRFPIELHSIIRNKIIHSN